jgi:hypothetical protein
MKILEHTSSDNFAKGTKAETSKQQRLIGEGD